MMEKKKRILLITTGGTIACVKTDEGLTPRLSEQELLSKVEEINTFCIPFAKRAMCIDSTNITPNDWLKIAKMIEDNYKVYDGFVISHGTDTLSYTASAISYLIQNPNKPIVLTGAQRPINCESTDARINLIDSFRFAANANYHGVVVVFDGKVIAGTRASKVRSKSFNAFNSINFPEVARIIDGKIFQYIYNTDNEKTFFYNALSPRVGVITLTPGLDAAILDKYFEVNDAVIISSYGTGGIPVGANYQFYEVIKKWLKENKTLVMATQVTNEGSDMSIYRVAVEAREAFDFIEAFDMNPSAVLTKMMWILALTNNKTKIKELFYQTINFDILYKGN